MGRHASERAPANDLFMVTVLSALLLLFVIILMLAADWLLPCGVLPWAWPWERDPRGVTLGVTLGA